MFNPIIGINSKGFATSPNNGQRPVVIEYVLPNGFYLTRDLETQQCYQTHYTNFTMSNLIPPRHRQAAFDRVAAHWGTALAQHPIPLSIDASPMIATSFMRLLRDARDAKNIYGWKHPSIDEQRWTEIAQDLTISESGNHVVLGTRLAKFPPKQVGMPVIKSNEVVITWHTPAELEAFCLLIDHKVLNPRPSFVLFNLTPEIVASLEQRYEIAFVQHEHDTTKWIVI